MPLLLSVPMPVPVVLPQAHRRLLPPVPAQLVVLPHGHPDRRLVGRCRHSRRCRHLSSLVVVPQHASSSLDGLLLGRLLPLDRLLPS